MGIWVLTSVSLTRKVPLVTAVSKVSVLLTPIVILILEHLRTMQHKPDRRCYLTDLITSYNNILNNTDSPFALFAELISEEKHKCEHELQLIKQTDMEAKNGSAYAYPFKP